MTPGAYAQESVRLRQFKVVEEHIGHLGVVVLAGVNEPSPEEFRILEELLQQRRYLHEVRSCPGHKKDVFATHAPSRAICQQCLDIGMRSIVTE
jgi:hypothetical protein